MSKIATRKLGSLEVPSMGFGCMGMSAFYATTSPVSEEDCIATIHAAIDSGCNFLDTSDIYGPFTNESLVGKAIKNYPRDQVILATKFGIVYDTTINNFRLDGTRKHAREACEASLSRLGVDYIDLYYLHRKDPATDISETMAELKLLFEEGKIRHIGLSECSPADIRKAHAIHPITAVQLEWSLWTRDAEEEVIPTCRELGIGIVAYSPLGRGFLTGSLKSLSDLADDDWRRQVPRFEQDAFQKNLEIVKKIEDFAANKGCTTAQLALSWVLHQGEDVVPIPGTKRVKYLKENLAAVDVKLSVEDLKMLEEAVAGQQVVGMRYPEEIMSFMTYEYGKLQ